MASQTPNIGLQLYEDKDPANLTDQYNASMETLDGMIPGISNNSGQAIARLNALGITNPEAAAESKTSWDGAVDLSKTNEENIASIDANLNALGANSVEDATNFRTQALSRSGKILVLGDSYSDPAFNSNNWLVYFKNFTSAEINNISERGAAWAQGGGRTNRNFYQIIQDLSVNDGESYDIIIIYGGYNDYRTQQPVSEAEQNARLGMAMLRQKFPNAVIHHFYTNWGQKTLDNYGANYIGAMTRVGKQYSYCVNHDNAAFWLLSPLAYAADQVHPNETGYAQISYFIARGISGVARPANTVLPFSQFVPEDGVTLHPSALPFIWIRDGWLEIPTLQITFSEVFTNFSAKRAFTIPSSAFLLTHNQRVPAVLGSYPAYLAFFPDGHTEVQPLGSGEMSGTPATCNVLSSRLHIE